jgi:hypothetical protein
MLKSAPPEGTAVIMLQQRGRGSEKLEALAWEVQPVVMSIKVFSHGPMGVGCETFIT